MKQNDREKFWDEGFLRLERGIESQVIREANAAFDEILHDDSVCEEVIVLELSGPGRSAPDQSIIRIENPQLAHLAFHRLLRNETLGRVVAALFDATVVQVFFAHVTSMPPSGITSRGIGWHQEEQYPDFIQGPFPTAWIPLRPINEKSSPLAYVPGSHKFGVFPDRGIRSELTHSEQRAQILERWRIDWKEERILGPLGTFSIHHSRTIHGTAANSDQTSRRALVLHMRTEKNKITKSQNALYQKYVDTYMRDLEMSPVIFG